MNIRFIRLAGFLVPFLSFSWPKRQRLKKLAATDPKESFRLASQDVGNACRKMLDICGTELEVDGVENIPDEPVLFVGNHNSYFDIVVTAATIPKGTGYVGKDSLKKIPGIKGWMDLLHCLYLDRSDIKKGLEMIKEGINNILSGYSMCIYPEGTRSKTGELGEFKGGALKMAQRSDCPIVPVACSGTRDIFENNKNLRIMPAHVRISYGEPFRISELPKDQRRFAAKYTREQLISLLEKHHKEDI